jgi:hypothetical protein
VKIPKAFSLIQQRNIEIVDEIISTLKSHTEEKILFLLSAFAIKKLPLGSGLQLLQEYFRKYLSQGDIATEKQLISQFFSDFFTENSSLYSQLYNPESRLVFERVPSSPIIYFSFI